VLAGRSRVAGTPAASVSPEKMLSSIAQSSCSWVSIAMRNDKRGMHVVALLSHLSTWSHDYHVTHSSLS
jgi:hypothetical protein